LKVGAVKKKKKKKKKKKIRAKKRRSKRSFGGGGKPEKLRTKEIKLMRVFWKELRARARDFSVCRRRVGDVVFRRRAVD